MNRRRRRASHPWLAGLVGVLLVAGCDRQTAQQTAPPPPEVFVTEVVQQDVPIVREWVGETRGRADIEIRARVSGFLEGIHFEEGGQVTKGQLLYTIDKSELLQRVSASEADLAEAKTELAYAETDERRYKPLVEMNAVSQRDYDSAVARRDAAEATVEAAEAMLRLARIQLGYTEIKSPMDGVIGLTKAKVGDYVGQPPNPVVLNTVSDVTPIHVRFPIGEREYLEMARRFATAPSKPQGGRERAREKIPLDLILADGTMHPETGHALFIERNVDARTGTVTIEAEFPNPGGVLRPGQYGRVRAVVDTLKDASLIPQRAVQELQGQHQVWVVGADDTVELRNVTMGRRIDRLWVVDDGLAPGDRVVVEGIQRLRSGMTVNAKAWEPPATPEGAVGGI